MLFSEVRRAALGRPLRCAARGRDHDQLTHDHAHERTHDHAARRTTTTTTRPRARPRPPATTATAASRHSHLPPAGSTHLVAQPVRPRPGRRPDPVDERAADPARLDRRRPAGLRLRPRRRLRARHGAGHGRRSGSRSSSPAAGSIGSTPPRRSAGVEHVRPARAPRSSCFGLGAVPDLPGGRRRHAVSERLADRRRRRPRLGRTPDGRRRGPLLGSRRACET